MSLNMTARNLVRITALLSVTMLLAPSLSGCGGLSRALGVSKRPPDEFTVVGRAPLVVPPDYNLMPPKKGSDVGAAANMQADPRKMAYQALFPVGRNLPGRMPAISSGDVSSSALGRDPSDTMSGNYILSPDNVPTNDDIYLDHMNTDNQGIGAPPVGEDVKP